MQWYYAVNGQQSGPVDESMISAMAKDGKLKPGDLVWNPSFGNQWKQAADVPGLMAGSAEPAEAQRHPEATIVIGSGGATSNRDLMAQAREGLTGNWGLAAGVTIVYGLIQFAISMVPILGGLVQVAVAGAFMLGLYTVFLSLARQQEAVFGFLFSGFRRFLAALGTYLLMAAFVMLVCLPGIAIMVTGAIWGGIRALPMLSSGFHGGMSAAPFGAASAGGPGFAVVLTIFGVGMLVACIPSIILSLGYSMTYFVLADDPGCGPLDAVFRSWRLMRGFKWKLFCLGFRFMGWALLCAIFTLGIGFLWLWPYMMVSYGRFYDDIHPSDEVVTL